MDKIKLLHYTDKNIKNKISIKFFNTNYYTKNDYKISSIKRAFYYLNNSKIENRFLGAKFIYTSFVEKKQLYNLDLDKLKLKNKFNNVNDLVYYLKRHYLGAYYSIGKLKIAILFKSIKFKDKIKRGL